MFAIFQNEKKRNVKFASGKSYSERLKIDDFKTKRKLIARYVA